MKRDDENFKIYGITGDFRNIFDSYQLITAYQDTPVNSTYSLLYNKSKKQKTMYNNQ